MSDGDKLELGIMVGQFASESSGDDLKLLASAGDLEISDSEMADLVAQAWVALYTSEGNMNEERKGFVPLAGDRAGFARSFQAADGVMRVLLIVTQDAEQDELINRIQSDAFQSVLERQLKRLTGQIEKPVLEALATHLNRTEESKEAAADRLSRIFGEEL